MGLDPDALFAGELDALTAEARARWAADTAPVVAVAA